MARARALKDAVRDPLAKKEAVAAPVEYEGHGVGHYVATIFIGLIAGVVGTFLFRRILRIL